MERKNGNWTIRGTTKIFGNDFFSVFEDDVVQPDGADGKYGTIELKPGVAVLPLDDEGFVYLTRQFRYAIGREVVEAVAGGIDEGDVLEGAKRELKEELGIEAEEWISLGRSDVLTSLAKCSSELFLAGKLTFGEEESEGTEEISPVKLRLADAVEKVMAGEITHGETCLLILKAARMK